MVNCKYSQQNAGIELFGAAKVLDLPAGLNRILFVDTKNGERSWGLRLEV